MEVVENYTKQERWVPFCIDEQVEP